MQNNESIPRPALFMTVICPCCKSVLEVSDCLDVSPRVVGIDIPDPTLGKEKTADDQKIPNAAHATIGEIIMRCHSKGFAVDVRM